MISDHTTDAVLKALHSGEYLKAKNACDTLLKTEPKNVSLLNLASAAELLLGNLDEGLKKLRLSLTTEPNSDAFSNLATTIGKIKTLEKEDAEIILTSLWSILLKNPDPAVFISETLDKLKFKKTTEKLWLDTAFKLIVLPFLHILCKHELIDIALFLEIEIYSRYAKCIEGEKHFKAIYQDLSPCLEKLGEKAKFKKILDPEIKIDKIFSDNETKIAFLIQNGAMLAHVEYLINFLSSQKEIRESTFSPVILSIFGKYSEINEKCSQLNIDLIEIENYLPNSGFSARYAWIREFLEHNNIDTIVAMSSVTNLAFAYSFGLAPNQIWWSLKYKGFKHPNISGYLTQSHPDETFIYDGQLWHGGVHASKSWYDQSKRQDARELRKSYKCKTLYGCLAREEKMKHHDFIESVVSILKKAPDAAFLWTGRNEENSIKERFINAGVYEQCFFVGWIDTRLYAQVIDVFLDTYPLGCGFTLLETMASAKPVVFMDSIVNYAQVIKRLNNQLKNNTYLNISNFEDCIAKDKESYIRIALNYHNSDEAKYNAGMLNKLLIKEHFSNTKNFAQRFSKQILKIRKKTGASKND